ncbi:MAG: ATP-binding protein [Synechococcus sp.]|nr:ATP-binding protein [Synechococcus sp.]
MTQPPLRCHLLIGPPGSGKTTLARDLAPLLRGESGQPGLVLSTDAIRAELFGDPSVQGPWDEIRARLLRHLDEAVAAGRPAIIDATHARRPWRLLYTQVLCFARPVEWIGWWLTTPQATCLEWASRRERAVPEAVIKEFHAAINHRQFGPGRAEGLAALVTLNPAAGEATPEALQLRLGKLDGQIRNAVNKQRSTCKHLHRYARLVDLERLLFLLRLLTGFNGLDTRDPATAASLAEICSPLPEGDTAECAAACLSHWNEVHGGNSDVYGDVEALRGDLAWLEANGFTRLDWKSDGPIDPGPFTEPTGGGIHGGYPSLADPAVFRRVFTLLRHILKHPFDAPSGGSSGPGSPLYQHLIDRLSDIDGSYRADQEAVLRNDLRHLLRPYGFAPELKGRPDSRRQGYAIGTALLSADQLLEVHSLLRASMERLSDASQKPLLLSLEDRLRRADLLDGGAARSKHGRRALAHRSFTEERSGTLAARDQSERIERAIRERRRVWLRHLPDVVTHEQRKRGDDGRFRAWPLQLLFHNISWYLVFEFDAIGSSDGLIRTLRLDRLVLLGLDGNVMRSRESRHERAMARLERLLHVCGGLWFGTDLSAQLAVMPAGEGAAEASGTARGELPAAHRHSPGRDEIPGRHWYDTLRFSCTPQVFELIREEPNRFPPEHTAYSRPIPGQSSWSQGPLDTLSPNPATDSHPYPVELLLPRWTLQNDWDLHTWLFRWGNGMRIEQPLALRELHLQQARGVVALYGAN